MLVYITDVVKATITEGVSVYECACFVYCVKADAAFLLMLPPACVCKHACPLIMPLLSVYMCVSVCLYVGVCMCPQYCYNLLLRCWQMRKVTVADFPDECRHWWLRLIQFYNDQTEWARQWNGFIAVVVENVTKPSSLNQVKSLMKGRCWRL